MNFDWKKIAIAIGVLIVLLALALFLILRQGGSLTPVTGGSFGQGNSAEGVVVGQSGTGASTLPSFSSGTSTPAQKVFEIASGPVVGATLIEEGQPTTTAARYITGGDGHVLELTLDAPGATPRIISNTTIPGIERALWTDGGNGVIVQYLDGGAIKSAHLQFSSATSSGTVAITFFPDDILDIAVSQDGGFAAYLLRSSSGADGYISKSNGTNAKKIFSLPLSQISLSWPSAATLFAYNKSAGGVQGIAFSIDAKTGAVTPTLYGEGLTATANPAFSYILYRTDNSISGNLFAENIPTGITIPITLPFSLQAALPEECVWSPLRNALAYCAAPAEILPPGYLDLWHRGEASVPDSLVALNLASSTASLIATPGTQDGGETADMIALSLSPSERYLSFISKDDEALWGVRLK